MLNVQSLEDLVNDATITPELMVLSPWLPENGLAMLAGWRGVGKTMLALGAALAIASGAQILGWKAPNKRRVLYLDGEMALSQMQQRVQELIKGHPEFAAGASNVFLCSHAMQDKGIPNLVRYQKARKDIEELMEELEIEVLFLDNLSALCNSDVENDVESWTVMQSWLLDLRRKGKTVVFLHHAGKPDDKGFIKQRGTSKREDVLNTSILLRGDQGGFLIIYDKHRGFEPRIDHRAEMQFTPGCCKIVEKTTKDKTAREKLKVDMKKLESSLG